MPWSFRSERGSSSRLTRLVQSPDAFYLTSDRTLLLDSASFMKKSLGLRPLRVIFETTGGFPFDPSLTKSLSEIAHDPFRGVHSRHSGECELQGRQLESGEPQGRFLRDRIRLGGDRIG